MLFRICFRRVSIGLVSCAAYLGIPACSDSSGTTKAPEPANSATPTTPPTTTPPVTNPPSEGGTPPDSCKDPADPGGTVATALSLPGATDADETGSAQPAFLAGDSDVDIYKLHGVDTATAFMDPVISVATTSKLRICAFVKCAAGTTILEPIDDRVTDRLCGSTGSPDKLDGMDGCCADQIVGPTDVKLDYKCAGTTNETADFYFRVDRGPAKECSQYTLRYHL